MDIIQKQMDSEINELYALKDIMGEALDEGMYYTFDHRPLSPDEQANVNAAHARWDKAANDKVSIKRFIENYEDMPPEHYTPLNQNE